MCEKNLPGRRNSNIRPEIVSQMCCLAVDFVAVSRCQYKQSISPIEVHLPILRVNPCFKSCPACRDSKLPLGQFPTDARTATFEQKCRIIDVPRKRREYSYCMNYHQNIDVGKIKFVWKLHFFFCAKKVWKWKKVWNKTFHIHFNSIVDRDFGTNNFFCTQISFFSPLSCIPALTFSFPERFFSEKAPTT